MERTGSASMAWAQSGVSFLALADGAEHIDDEEKGAWVTGSSVLGDL